MAEKTIEIDDELQTEIAEKVAQSLDIPSQIEAAATKAAEAVVAAMDKPAVKELAVDSEEIDENGVTKEVIADADKGIVEKMFKGDASLAKSFPLLAKSPYAKMSKERRFFLGVKALLNKDGSTVRELNEYNGELYALKAYQDGRFADLSEKAGYANDAVSADGGALVPDPDFNTTVYENLPKYGVAFKDANVQSTDRTAVYALSLTGTIAFTNVAEAGAISGTKLAFNRGLTNLVKYAAIVPATEELTEDSIVDYWQIVTNEIARNYAKTADAITFTDTTMGILHTTGIITQAVSGNGTTIAWDDLLAAEGKTEDGLDTAGFKWYMRKETFYRLAQIKASTSGVYLADSMLAGWNPNPNSPTTPWGTPVEFTRVLPKSTEVSSNGGFAVYGDLKNYNFYYKNGMQLTMLTEATVKDSAGSDFNLATQDGLAMRVVVRLLGILPLGNASKFVVLGTGTVS